MYLGKEHALPNSFFFAISSTCERGAWRCTTNVCYGTCIIYGSGHFVTFDGRYYDFDGNCEYVASQVIIDYRPE